MSVTTMRIAGIFAGGIVALVTTACGTSESPAPAPAGTPSPSVTTVTVSAKPAPPAAKPAPAAAAKPAAPVLGPTAFGRVKLGTTFDQARKAGFVHEYELPPDQGCGVYKLYVGGRITPEGLAVGATAAKAKSVYPQLDLDDVKQLSRAKVRVPGNANAVYRLGFKNGAVADITLQMRDQKCYE
ncbi:hypothetical protein [Actinophytocola sp.]|uniref:hypothetical protein n=1 Tax=Actinophytocola sp. TaxID=1872138 RepID=UPI002D7E96C2|nr:hypothetical protein [Actinophytocola sp.]HET9138592.1 hypothetical protein [Actinophytocola sp.]